MRLFKLLRREDVSGVSGVGYVAEGMITTSGKVLMIWYGYGAGTETFDSKEKMMYVHGHDGRTTVEYAKECDCEKAARLAFSTPAGT